MPKRPGSMIDAIEALYTNIEREHPRDWLPRVLPLLVECGGDGVGGFAHAFYANGPVSNWRISRPWIHDAPPETANTVLETFASSPPEFLERNYVAIGPVGTFSAAFGMDLTQLPSNGAMAAQHAIRDQLFLNATNPDGFGLLVDFNLREAKTLRPPERRRLSMLSAHVAAAARILLNFARAGDEDVAGERAVAIFEANGKLAHLDPAHEKKAPSLREHARRIDRARGAQRHAEPETALASWEALLGGKYSLVDRFEADGRRYVVAHVNEPGVSDPRGLTRAEAIVASWASRGHSDKLIAYELGMAPGTVSGLLARVFKKLGARTRAQMVRFMRAPTTATPETLATGSEIMVFSAPDPTLAESSPLTAIEREIASLVALGKRNAEIAHARKVSERTIAKQLTRIYEKLGVTSRVDLARRFEQ